MPTPDITAGSVMDAAASLMNDTNKQVYTYTAQLPYLKMALQDLRKKLQLDNIPVTNETSAALSVTAGTTAISFITSPALPTDLIEIQRLWERSSSSYPWTPMVRKEFLPHYLEGQTVTQFLIWSWIDNEIKVLESSADIDIKIDYIKQLLDLSSIDQNSVIGVINVDSYLQFRTAALCARFIAENETRAQSLDNEAITAFDILTGIESKAAQSITTRHRPFRAGWKSRGLW